MTRARRRKRHRAGVIHARVDDSHALFPARCDTGRGDDETTTSLCDLELP